MTRSQICVEANRHCNRFNCVRLWMSCNYYNTNLFISHFLLLLLLTLLLLVVVVVVVANLHLNWGWRRMRLGVGSVGGRMERVRRVAAAGVTWGGMLLIDNEDNDVDDGDGEQVTIFPNLKNIKVSSMKTLSGICNGFEFPIDSFVKLETLVIDDCDKLGYVFTSHVGIFQHVSNLRVTNCKSIKAIFDPAWENKPASSKDATTNLQDVHLESLPKLEHVFKFNRKKNQLDGILSLNNLHKIWVQDCERLENIFSVPVAKTLENNLEDLMVSDCSQLREIVFKEEDVDRKISSLTAFNFLKLATIKFLRLPKFKSFYPGTEEIKFPALNNLSIEECEKLEPFREEIIDAQTKPILFPEMVINNLKSIQIESRHATSSTNYDYRRDNLEELHLSKLKDTKILYSFLHSNPNMKNLWLNDCSFEELVPLERLAKIESLGVVPQLKSLKLTDLPNLRRIGFERDPILQRIESLVFQNCSILKTIAPCNVFLSHLTKLEVVDCERLEYLMSPSTARSLGQLNTMKVINCGSLKEIVSEKGQGRKEDNKDNGDIIFKQLGTIELVSLKHLKSFCSSKNCAFQFPTLEKFVMFFEGMEEVSVSDHLAHLQQLMQSKGVGQQENVFKKGLREELFNNLKTLKLSGCEFEPYAIPSNVLFTFKNLKELEVDNCEKIKGIFEMNDTKMMGTSFQLKKLTLEALPNVKHVWQPKKQGILSFKNLQIVTVNECKDLRTLFPIALARDLKKLEELDVRDCDELSNIIEAEEAGTVDEHLVFPCLTTLALCYLPSLTDFCSQKFTLECPELNCFDVYDCNDQLELFQSHLEENQNNTSTTKQPLFMNTKDISKMENLTLNWRHTQALGSWLRKFKDENLESLNELYLLDDDGKSNCNVPVGLFEKTPNLESLEVSYYCDETLKNILPSHDDEANNNKEILGKLKELYLFKLNELQSMSGVENLSKQLRLLDVSDCPKLTTIVLQSSSNLKELHIESCEALLRLFTSSTARMLIHLEELEVETCESLEEIVGEEQQNAMTEDDVIEFKQLERITLRSLESLECFYSGNATLKLPSLIQLDIVDCSKMKVFSHGNVSVSRRIQVSYNSSDDLVFHHDLNAAAVWQFLSEERIVLSDVPDLQEIWASKVPIPVDCPSCKFQYLEVDGCDFLSDAIIPSHLLPLLTNLEELVVRNCDSVKAIFDVRVKDTPTSDSSTVVIPLKKLTLEKLPILKHVWNNDPNKGGLNFPYLEEVTIDECKRIKHLFPASIAGDNLRELDVGNCEEMEEIVAKDANKELIKFHKLAKLMLFNLPKLRCVISSMMHIPEGCEISSNALLPSHLLSSLNDLKELVVIDCDSIEAIFDVKYSSPTQDPNMIDIPLKTIILENLPTLRHVWNEDPKGGFRLPLLNEVIVKECKCITSLFPASVFKNKVRKLDVRNCVKLEEIVGKDEAITAGEENDGELLMFPCLTTLTLWELPALRCIWSGMRILDWPELKELDIVAPRLQRLSLNKEDIIMIEQGQLQVDLQKILFLKLHSFHDDLHSFPDDFISKIQLTAIEQIAVVDSGFKQIFNSQRPEHDTQNYTKILSQLKGLVLRDLYKLESIGFEQTWMAPLLENLEHLKILACNCLMNLAPSTVSFSKLTQLNVKDCAKLEYLFTSSTANSFAELKRMSLSNCELLETVMVGDGDNDNEDVTFPKLSFIYLGNLPKLESFFKGKPNLNFPQLHKIFITECKGMQTFYQGNVVSPELQGVKDTEGEFCQSDDLNTAIKHYLRGEEDDNDSTKQEEEGEEEEDSN
ncbi:hypothetical protein Ahy_B02g058123 [Arachis hypogaea]|uniref:Disease resistance protein At4g27190-like leucine-rich repeats domain-containing protein n=1 Tax=Arachis hypogaea TaxID=3818 RepID=A0A445ADW4_ARAHY|nr:hypothetical protein Ahy_B02g058123 [Arachis hypogaea]